VITSLFLALLPVSLQQAEAIQEPPVTVAMEVRRPGSVEALASGSKVFAGEMLQVDIHLAVERDFLKDNLISTWRLPLDVPVELRTPWLDGALGSEWREGPAKGMVSIVLDREVSRVQEILGSSDGNLHYGLRRWILVPETEGELALAPASVHFTWASDFADDMVRGLVPVDRQQSVLSSEAWTGSIKALPQAPEEFSGVIGNMSWTVQTTAPKEGQWVWHMEVHGSAWSTPNMLPEFPKTAGLSLQGVRREELVDGYRAIMEFQLEEGFARVRDWTWTTFSPEGSGKYQQWRMPDIEQGAASYEAVLVKASAPPPVGKSVRAKKPITSAKGKDWWAVNWIPGAVLVMTLAALATVGWRWRRAAIAEEPISQEARKPDPPAADLLDDLAARLGCHRAALYDADLAARLTEQSWPEELTQELLAAVEVHAAHHFRGQGAGLDAAKEAELRRQLALKSS